MIPFRLPVQHRKKGWLFSEPAAKPAVQPLAKPPAPDPANVFFSSGAHAYMLRLLALPLEASAGSEKRQHPFTRDAGAMPHAQRLLLTTALDTKQVAAAVHCPFTSHFIYAFHAHFGYYPGQLRQPV